MGVRHTNFEFLDEGGHISIPLMKDVTASLGVPWRKAADSSDRESG